LVFHGLMDWIEFEIFLRLKLANFQPEQPNPTQDINNFEDICILKTYNSLVWFLLVFLDLV
jgi:hypothetical protein